MNDADIEILSLPGDLPDIFVIHRPSGMAIRVQDQATIDEAEAVGKARLAVCVHIMQEVASMIDWPVPAKN